MQRIEIEFGFGVEDEPLAVGEGGMSRVGCGGGVLSVLTCIGVEVVERKVMSIVVVVNIVVIVIVVIVGCSIECGGSVCGWMRIWMVVMQRERGGTGSSMIAMTIQS